jgi:hypothetical protein
MVDFLIIVENAAEHGSKFKIYLRDQIYSLQKILILKKIFQSFKNVVAFNWVFEHHV